MKTSTKGLIALMNHEGVVLQSYRDSVGVWTIGVGHTAAAGVPKPSPGLKISLKQAVELFREDIRKYEAGVDRAVKVPLKQWEFDALVSFHFNTGAIGRASFVKKLNAGDRAGAIKGIMDWRRPAEIIGRRKKERALFRDGVYGQLSTVLVYPGVSNNRPTGAMRMSTNEVMEAALKPSKTPENGAVEPAIEAAPTKTNWFIALIEIIMNWIKK